MTDFFEFCNQRHIQQSNLYTLYRPSGSTHLVPRLWWKYAICATMYKLRHFERESIWAVAAAQNMNILHNLKKALASNSLAYTDDATMNSIFHNKPADVEHLFQFRSQLAAVREENEMLKKVIGTMLSPSVKHKDSTLTGVCAVCMGRDLPIYAVDFGAQNIEAVLDVDPSRTTAAQHHPSSPAILKSHTLETTATYEDPILPVIQPVQSSKRVARKTVMSTSSHRQQSSARPRSTIALVTPDRSKASPSKVPSFTEKEQEQRATLTRAGNAQVAVSLCTVVLTSFCSPRSMRSSHAPKPFSGWTRP